MPAFVDNYAGPGPPYPESAFTRAHVACSHPEWWTADDDESAEHEITQLVVAFIAALQPELVLEAGTAFGQTAKRIGEQLAANGHGHLISLDIDGERIENARALCEGLPVSFEVCDAVAYEPPGMLDFAWIDSGPNRAAEIEHLQPWLRSGCIVGVHDTGPQHSVAAGLAVLGGFRSIYLPTPRGCAFLERL